MTDLEKNINDLLKKIRLLATDIPTTALQKDLDIKKQKLTTSLAEAEASVRDIKSALNKVNDLLGTAFYLPNLDASNADVATKQEDIDATMAALLIKPIKPIEPINP
jgi:hypothetical protein